MYRQARWAHHSLFRELCEHDYDGRLVLPDHPPEVLNCVLQRGLGGDEGTLDLVALHTRRKERGKRGEGEKGGEGRRERREGRADEEGGRNRA